MRQRRTISFLLVLVGFLLSFQPAKANITGKVSNKAGRPIANAVCSLVVKGIKATTGADGSFLLTTTGVSFKSFSGPSKTNIVLRKNFLDFTVAKPSAVKIDFFDVKGNLIKKEVVENIQPGAYRFNIAENLNTTNLFLIKVTIGEKVVTFKYVPGNLKNIWSSCDRNNGINEIRNNSAKIMAIIDTLKVRANNYIEKKVEITSYDTTVNITLDTLDESMVTVRLDQEKQTIVGFGINATIMPSGKTLPWKQLFSLDGPDALGLSILRIGMDENGNHRGVPSDWETARKQYGAKIIGSCWSAPAAWKTNKNVNKGGHLLPEYYDDWAKMIAQYAAKYNLYAMSIANECDFASCATTPEPSKGEKPCDPPLTNEYPSMVYTAKEMVAFVKEAKKAFKQFAPNVKIIAPEASLWIHVWSNLSCIDKHPSSDPLGCGCFSNDINDSAALKQCAQKCLNGDGYDYGHWLAKDDSAWNSFDILGVHQYESQIAYPWPADVTGGKRTKEVWQTEMSGVMHWPEQGPSIDINNGVAVARWIQSALTVGEASVWCYWWYEAYYQNDNEGLALTQQYPGQIAKRYYTMGNYSRYMRPGQKVVNITGTNKLPQKVLLTASKDDKGKVVIVAVNETTSAQTVKVRITGGKVPTSFKPIVTNESSNWKEGTPIQVTDDVLTMQLDKMSVTTFVGE